LLRKGTSSVSGVGAIIAVVGVFVVLVVVLIVVDATRTPPATPQETCTLVRHIVLPDNCVCSTAGKRAVRGPKQGPYLFFWTQAAGLCHAGLRHRSSPPIVHCWRPGGLGRRLPVLDHLRRRLGQLDLGVHLVDLRVLLLEPFVHCLKRGFEFLNLLVLF
jgi:hypothetical protein